MFLHQKNFIPFNYCAIQLNFIYLTKNQSWIFESGDRESLGKTHPFPNGYKIALNETP